MTKRKRKPIDYSKISTQEPAAEEAANDIVRTPLSSNDERDSSIEPPASDEAQAPYFKVYCIATPLLNVRQAPSFNAEKAGYYQYKGNVVEIQEVINTDDGCIWGKMASGYYICLYDATQNVWFVEEWNK